MFTWIVFCKWWVCFTIQSTVLPKVMFQLNMKIPNCKFVDIKGSRVFRILVWLFWCRRKRRYVVTESCSFSQSVTESITSTVSSVRQEGIGKSYFCSGCLVLVMLSKLNKGSEKYLHWFKSVPCMSSPGTMQREGKLNPLFSKCKRDNCPV